MMKRMASQLFLCINIFSTFSPYQRGRTFNAPERNVTRPAPHTCSAKPTVEFRFLTTRGAVELATLNLHE
jgi:hypothetical protein